MNWIVFDIGNSAVKGGLFEGSVLHHTFRLPHDSGRLAAAVSGAIGSADVERAGVASVVPKSAESVIRVLEDAGIPATHIRYTMRLPFEMAYRTPETLGADRLAAAAAAWVTFGHTEGSVDKQRDVIVLDAGTALTCEVVDRSGVYLGGAIAPGPVLMQRALNRETAQLPDVPLTLPDAPIGRSTAEAIQSGIMYGYIETVCGLLKRINRSLGREAFVVATGGWSSVLDEHVPDIDEVAPNLVLEGVKLLMELNA